MQEFDTVEVIVEKEKYAKWGIHKGMVGTILEPQKMYGGWLVYFPDEEGADTIDGCILEKDLKLVFRKGMKVNEH